jgi:hypothetical protein
MRRLSGEPAFRRRRNVGRPLLLLTDEASVDVADAASSSPPPPPRRRSDGKLER